MWLAQQAKDGTSLAQHRSLNLMERRWFRAPAPPTTVDRPSLAACCSCPQVRCCLQLGGNPDVRLYPRWNFGPILGAAHYFSPVIIEAGHSYTLQGRQLNGLSQAVSYGDDCSCATNYPMVRIKHLESGRVYFCRTFNHSTMGVATGTSIQSTTFKVPFGAPVGESEIQVIANGIASNIAFVNVRSVPLLDHPHV